MLLFLATKVLAADPPPTSTYGVSIPGTDCKSGGATDLMTYIGCIYQFATYLAIGLAILMIIWGGYKYMMSQGNPDSLQEAKDIVWGAIIGLFLLVFAYLILSNVIPGAFSPI